METSVKYEIFPPYNGNAGKIEISGGSGDIETSTIYISLDEARQLYADFPAIIAEAEAAFNHPADLTGKLLLALRHARSQMKRSGFCFEMDDAAGDDGYRSIDEAIAEAEAAI